jgi:energy-coupling factor transport system ATP-binding protein
VLSIRNLCVGFGGSSPAVIEASLAVRAGCRLLICGAAGSGKTTLLNAAAGIIPRLVRPEVFSGNIDFNDRPVNSIPSDEWFGAVSIVAQNVEDQLWDLSVEDLIAFPLENRAVKKQQIRERIQDLLSSLELNDLRGRRVLTLSGGERRMVAIAAALAAAPRLLVLDEPTIGLDPAARQRLVRILEKLRTEIPALLISEQDPTSVSAVVDEIALLNSGMLSPAAPKDALLDQETVWLNAGTLPPRRHRTIRQSAVQSITLLSTSGLRTRLTRSDGRPVLEDINFNIRAGEIVGLIGRNGAGKTTLFQSILGLAGIVNGSIFIQGQDAARWTPARRARSIAYLPQNMRRVLFNMTLLQELTFAITASTSTPKDPTVNEEAKAYLAKYGLEGLEETNPFALSSRQQALLGLSCADAARSSIAILDEPLLARDLHGRRMLDLFLNEAASTGRAVMLISHDLELIAEAASRVLLLDQGRITFDGPTDDVWQSESYGSLSWAKPRFELNMESRHALS